MAKVLLAKTSLDGHWRGTAAVARALRDAGFEVVMLGMARADEIAAAAVQEDPDLIGLNVGGRLEIVERILDALAAACPGLPVVAGGTIAPLAARALVARGVAVFPPGSPLTAIVETARRLTTAGAGPA